MVEAPRVQYCCGYSRRELERLELQGGYYEEITRRFFQAAGVAPGMRVLDIGCGVGDVSFLAAEVVGASGAVLGIDRSPEAVATAGVRAAARGRGRVTFQVAEIDEMTVGDPFDALVGRFVLMHQADPARTLRHAARAVRPGGLVAVLESHLTASVAGAHSCPHSPTYDGVMAWMVEILRGAGAHPDMGLSLRRVFVAAGLAAPELWLQARVEGGPDAAIYRYIAESLRSMAPQAERLGIAARFPADIDALEAQLREDVAMHDGVLASPLVVGAWCRR